MILGCASSARAQWGYPGGYGGFGWGGWGGGETVQGSVARGLALCRGAAGYYNQSTAVARSINADTVMRWNQYWWESQVAANRAERERLARRQQATIQTREAVEKRLRENPEQRDIFQGDALNLAVEEINDPRLLTGGSRTPLRQCLEHSSARSRSPTLRARSR
ncbi:MAG: hypothetical protein U0794_10620 [Isosphaeraceae bacterium]